ncbi:hypothetical protein D9M68_545230 [compost metagenome]
MPSTVFTSVSVPLASSTVITPSLPTFCIASAISEPITSSLFAEIAATCLILLLSSPTVCDCSFKLDTTAATALSMPRFKSIGLAPAATFLIPAVTIACARTVAVVVPSPAISAVFEATSFTICAPMFSIGSFKSISLATETPSLVMVGEPNFLSIITFRPFGPKVTFTAFARISTPLLRASLASTLYFTCFAIFFKI